MPRNSKYDTANGSHPEMRVITCNLPRKFLLAIKKYIEWGICPSTSEYIRRAVHKQLLEDATTKRYVEEVYEATEDDLIKIPGYNGNKPIKVLRRLE